MPSTDPHAATSHLRIDSLSAIPGGWRITIPSAATRTYRVEWSPDLVQWFILADAIPGTGAPIAVDDLTAHAVMKRFYKVIAHP